MQPDAQKAPFKKSDPVALYQKYQQEWKQISLPGENRHSEVRWAVREKMLGTDPHPVVIIFDLFLFYTYKIQQFLNPFFTASFHQVNCFVIKKMIRNRNRRYICVYLWINLFDSHVSCIKCK